VENRPLPARPLTAPITACGAVTRTEVIDALGRTVGEGSETVAGAESTCDYATQRGLVTVVIERVAAMPEARKEIESLKRVVPEGSVRDAEGIGAPAFFLDIPGAGTQLHILREHECLLISVLGFGEPAEVANAAEKIARKALSRL
jgi:hypothetical protein